MAYERQQPCNFIAKADADLSALQFFLVEMTADNTVGITTADNNRAAGVLQNKPESGQHATVCPLGVTKVRVGSGGIAYGAIVTVADSGWARGVSSGMRGIGYCIDGAGSGYIATAFINMANAIQVNSI